MGIGEKVLFQKDSLEKIETKLRGLKLTVKDKEVQSEINEILELFDEGLKTKNVSLKEMIEDKMNETKFSDPEQHFKLYMLYRKLEENKITEEEALKVYELYQY